MEPDGTGPLVSPISIAAGQSILLSLATAEFKATATFRIRQSQRFTDFITQVY